MIFEISCKCSELFQSELYVWQSINVVVYYMFCSIVLTQKGGRGNVDGGMGGFRAIIETPAVMIGTKTVITLPLPSQLPGAGNIGRVVASDVELNKCGLYVYVVNGQPMAQVT